ncbi:MAG: hypothetical protein PHG24_01455 [Candidatus Pacebacteria bacterium]|nr:hypothetical protein [Candidatus Paceibacterota bacterium]
MIRFNLIEKLKLVFTFGKGHKKENLKSGVICEGENATFINSKGSGPDAGMLDKGKNTSSINSEWKSEG